MFPRPTTMPAAAAHAAPRSALCPSRRRRLPARARMTITGIMPGVDRAWVRVGPSRSVAGFERTAHAAKRIAVITERTSQAEEEEEEEEEESGGGAGAGGGRGEEEE